MLVWEMLILAYIIVYNLLSHHVCVASCYRRSVSLAFDFFKLYVYSLETKDIYDSGFRSHALKNVFSLRK